VITTTGSGYSVNMISAVSAQGQLRFMLTQRTVTAVIFREFLKRLMIGTNKPVFVIVDGPHTHQAKLVKNTLSHSTEDSSSSFCHHTHLILIQMRHYGHM